MAMERREFIKTQSDAVESSITPARRMLNASVKRASTTKDVLTGAGRGLLVIKARESWAKNDEIRSKIAKLRT